MYNILNQQVLIRELNPQRPCPSLPKHCHMARAANRLRQKMRPKDPKDLTFEVQADCIRNDFLQDEIKVCTGFSMLNNYILFKHLISRDLLKQRHRKNQETSSRNVTANLIALLMKCCIFACVSQHWTCKRIPSAQRCLFKPFILIYAILVPFLICMFLN